MRLYRQDEAPEDEQGLLCRQSRLAGVVRLIVWCGVLAIPPIVGWRFGKPWVLWIFFAVAAVVLPMAALELAAQFRATNWLMRIGTDGVWINLHSYRDRDVVPDAPSIVRLDYAEIASVRQYTESYSTPSETTGPVARAGGGSPSTEWRDKFLEIELTHNQTGDLTAALKNLRFPPEPVPSPSGQLPVRRPVSPVWYVNPSRLRIAWLSSHGPVSAPGLARVLAELELRVSVAPPTRSERPNWRKLTPDEATDLARELVHVHGETIAATALLSHACRISHGEASTQVHRIEEEGSLRPIPPQ